MQKNCELNIPASGRVWRYDLKIFGNTWNIYCTYVQPNFHLSGFFAKYKLFSEIYTTLGYIVCVYLQFKMFHQEASVVTIKLTFFRFNDSLVYVFWVVFCFIFWNSSIFQFTLHDFKHNIQNEFSKTFYPMSFKK